ncbi:inorganic pyrophosphatase [bacterium]|nr:inorganic pyrophosphatase [bacterium]
MIKSLYKAHPWHGVSIGEKAPEVLNAYIEMIPTDTVKYEIDKETGHLKIDRPQKYSNYCPALYGFIPRTYCGERIGNFASTKTNRPSIQGDGDPMDICVLTERTVQHGDILVRAVPIGGFRMLDNNKADDKIIAVLYEDNVYGKYRTLSECPANLIDRLKHYFLTYKEFPRDEKRVVEITHIYDVSEAHEVIQASVEDYNSSIAKS